MEALIFDIKRYAVHDGPGIRQTVFFKGCPLSCWWCHNPESRKPKTEQLTSINKFAGKEIQRKVAVGEYKSIDEIMQAIEKDALFFEESGGGVTFSGGEPFMQAKALKQLLIRCKEAAFHTAIDTTGFVQKEVFEEVAPLANLILFDLKHTNEQEHVKYTGVSLQPILENLSFLSKIGKTTIIRFPVIPKINDHSENIENMKAILSLLGESIREIHLLPFHNIADSKYKRFECENKMLGTKGLLKEDVKKLVPGFESIGFKVKIGG